MPRRVRHRTRQSQTFASFVGAVIADTLAAAPAPTVTSNITTAADGTISGPVGVESTRQYRIAGFVDTSHAG